MNYSKAMWTKQQRHEQVPHILLCTRALPFDSGSTPHTGRSCLIFVHLKSSTVCTVQRCNTLQPQTAKKMTRREYLDENVDCHNENDYPTHDVKTSDTRCISFPTLVISLAIEQHGALYSKHSNVLYLPVPTAIKCSMPHTTTRSVQPHVDGSPGKENSMLHLKKNRLQKMLRSAQQQLSYWKIFLLRTTSIRPPTQGKRRHYCR